MADDALYGRNRKAIEKTIEAMTALGRLDGVDSARVAMVRALADAVDADPTNASLWREYRAAEVSLREVGDNDDDGFKELLESLSSSVGDKGNAGKKKSGG
jgi:hypothetical protein